jgi:N-acetylglutamate synthase-like GNAT family acetyltransferase
MNQLKIRHASQKDLAAIVQLMNELGYSVNKELIEDRLEKISQRNGRVIVAVDKAENVLGCVHAFIDLRLAEGEVGEIVSLVVNHDSQGQGIGTELLKKAMEWIQGTGCTKVKVRANTIRKEAHQFYRNHGFEEVKTQKIFLKNDL